MAGNKKPRAVAVFYCLEFATSERAALDDLVSLNHPADIEGDLAFGIRSVEVGAFQRALAGGEEVLAVDRADAFTAVMGARAVIDSALTEHS